MKFQIPESKYRRSKWALLINALIIKRPAVLRNLGSLLFGTNKASSDARLRNIVCGSLSVRDGSGTPATPGSAAAERLYEALNIPVAGLQTLYCVSTPSGPRCSDHLHHWLLCYNYIILRKYACASLRFP